MAEEEASSLNNALKSFSTILEERVKAVASREEQLKKRQKLFDDTYPESGSAHDVLQLNVGGQTGIAVLRRTLTQFEHSVLASKFSGRWDDQLEKDRDGNFFIDQNPADFMKLLSFLRDRTNQVPFLPRVKPPGYTSSFLRMLGYYGLLFPLYPVEITHLKGSTAGDFSVNETVPGQFQINSHELETFQVLTSEQSSPQIGAFDVVISASIRKLQLGWIQTASNNLKQKPAEVGLDVRNNISCHEIPNEMLGSEGKRVRCSLIYVNSYEKRMEWHVDGELILWQDGMKPSTGWSPCLAVNGGLDLVSFEYTG